MSQNLSPVHTTKFWPDDFWPLRGVGASLALFSSKKIYKIFQIFRHIESLDTCMKY